jgi:hypothetical protein
MSVTQTPRPFSTAAATNFAAAAQLATRQQTEGKAVAVEHDLDDGTSIYTVLLHNLTRVTVDVERQRITQVRPQPGGGNGRGAENRRVRMGRVVAALARGDVRLGFDAAAALAVQARGSGGVIEVALEWHEALELVLYKVEFHDGRTLYLRPDTGETVVS